MSVNDDILDALTDHAVRIEGLSNAQVRKTVALLKQIETDVTERLLTAGTDLSRARLETLLTEVQRIVASVTTSATGQLKIDLDALAVYEAQYQDDLFKDVLPVKWQTVVPAPYQILAGVNARPFQGRLLSEWFSDLDATTFKSLRDAIRVGYVEGRTTDQIVRLIRGTKAQGYKDGIAEITRRHAETTVRTAIAHTTNYSAQLYYEANDDLVKGVQWVSTLDARTSVICRGLDGKLFPLRKGPRPPAHPACRSKVTPITKSWRELGINLDDAPPGTRASMDGQVAADLTYSDWLRKRPVDFQESILGKTKAALFRDGGLTLDRFVSPAGHELTLDQLKQQESAAWAKAFTN